MNLDNYFVFTLVLLISIIFYILFRRIERGKVKNEFNIKTLKEAVFNDAEMALLGEDLDDLNPGKNPFKLENKNINLPVELIVNGKILEENLYYIRKDYDWLTRTINKKGFSKIEDIKYAFMDKSGRLMIK